MSRRVKASYKGVFSRRYDIAAGCDTDKEIIVVAVLNAITGDVEVREFRQDHVDLVRCIEWFGERKPEIIIIESTSTYHQLYYDGLLAAGQNIHVINPMVVKSLLRVEGKSDKGDAITLARLAASFDLHTSNVADSMQREMRLMFRTYD
jgi:transposase